MFHPSRALPLTVAAIVCALPAQAWAWGDQGHQMTAAIAYKQLPEQARKDLVAALKANKELFAMLTNGLPKDISDETRDMYVFMKAATWPDMIRSKTGPMSKEHRANWHYINMPIDFSGKDRKEPVTDWKPGDEVTNIVQAIAKCEADLKDPKLSADERAIRICWLLHLIGDIHQPLHAVSLFSAHYGKGDEGGNRIWVNDGERKVKLHSLWDGLPGSTSNPKTAAESADRLLKNKDFDRSKFKAQLEQTAPKQWALEGKAIAKESVYLEGQLPTANAEASEADPFQVPKGYMTKAHQIADQRVVLAGYRMADALKGFTPATTEKPATKPSRTK